jgi:tetratricopeptide (TPR) repeat protein
LNRGPILLYLLVAVTLHAAEPETIVPPTDQVSEFDARRELANVLRKLGKIVEAEDELRKLLQMQPNNPGITADLADLETSRGHFARSRQLYERALSESSNSMEIRLRYARQARSWGDFYRAEKTFRTYLNDHLQDVDAALDLATVLIGEQQFEAAEGVYQRLSRNPNVREKALVGLATARFQEQDYRGVLPYADAALEIDPDQVDALNLRGESLRMLHRYDEAKGPFRRLTMLPGSQKAGWIGLGRLARAQNDELTAERCFRRAQASDPSDITAAYYAAGKNIAGFLSNYVSRHNLGAAELSTLAGLCASDGYIDYAIALYQKVLSKDPEYFSARMGLAQVLSTAHRYNESIEILTRLREEFPGDSKIILTLARVLSYARRYEESRRVYLELISANPIDTVPRKEMARVANWSKKECLSRQDYAELYTPSVDDQLVNSLQRSAEGAAALRAVQPFPTGTDIPYAKYEWMTHLLETGRIPERFRPPVTAVLSDLSPVYRVQKSAWLESRAKWLSWNKRLLRSEYTYKELLAFQPGNQEGWTDLAQVQASQELSHGSVASYQQLLELDPLHTLANQAIDRANIAQSPALFARYIYWDEKGIGRASDIERQFFQSGTEFVWNQQTQLRVSGDYWLESPGSAAQAVAAGTTIGLRTVFNEYWRASAEWTYKEYFGAPYSPTVTGQAGLTLNAWDYIHLTLQYARVDEIHNQFGLQQGVQSDNVGLLFNSDLNHYVAASGGAVWTNYTDDNRGIWVTLAPAMILLDHPHTLKLVLRGDYRNTEFPSIFEFVGSQLANIIHPYWTPQDYFRGTVILEWRHDLSTDFYAGAQQHYYALRLGGGFDSTGNKDVIAEGEWHYDFLQHWAFEAHGGVDRSPAWNGASAYVSLIYRF